MRSQLRPTDVPLKPSRLRATPVLTWLVLVALDVGLVLAAVRFSELISFLIALALLAGSAATVGLLIRLRQPANTVGRLLAIGPILLVAAFGSYAIGVWRLQDGGLNDLLGGLIGAFASAAVVPAIAATFPAVGLVFPDGRLPGPRWRLPTRIVVTLLLGGTLVGLLSWSPESGLPRNPLAPGLPGELVSLGALAGSAGLIGMVVLAMAAVVVRFRRAGAVERQQLKWFLASLALTAVLFPISFLKLLGQADLVDILSVLAASLIPVSIGIAVLRYRLYEIDRLISRTIGWTVVSGVLVGLFAVGVVGFQALLAGITQGQTLAVAGSTLLAFALFQPLRRHVQASVDRRFDRARYDAQQMVSLFSNRLRDELDLQALAAEVGRVTAQTVRPQTAGLWLRNGPVRAKRPDSVTMSERSRGRISS